MAPDPDHTIDVPLERHWVQSDDIRLHVRAAGAKDAPLVVLLHGFPEFWYGWRHQIAGLADAGYRVVIPDQRGYNLSDAPGGVAAYDLRLLAKDVIAILRAAGRERAHLVGHDWGGVVAWWLGINRPDRVRSLSILNAPHPAVFVRTLPRRPRQLVRSLYILFFQVPVLPEWLLGRAEARGLARLLRMSGHPDANSDKHLSFYRMAWTRPGRLRGMIHWYRAGLRRALRTGVAADRVQAPTLLLWGAKDAALTEELAPLSADRCANARLEIIDGATHWVQHNAPAQVNETILEHLRETEDDRPRRR